MKNFRWARLGTKPRTVVGRWGKGAGSAVQVGGMARTCPQTGVGGRRVKDNTAGFGRSGMPLTNAGEMEGREEK